MSESQQRSDPSLEEREFFEDHGDDPDPMGIERRASARARSRRSRGVVMFGLFLVFAAVLTWLLFDDLAYFFSSARPEDLGRAEELTARVLVHNDFVQVAGIARDMCIRAEVFGSHYRYLYLLGSELGGRILIQSATGTDATCQGAEERTFAGRVIDTARTERYVAVVRYYREHFPTAPRQGPVYLLEHDLRPRQAWYFPAALALLAGLAGLNFWLLRRARRRAGAVDSGGTR